MGIWLTTLHAGVFSVNTNTLDLSLTFDPNSNQEWPVFQTKGILDQQMGPSKTKDLQIQESGTLCGIESLGTR